MRIICHVFHNFPHRTMQLLVSDNGLCVDVYALGHRSQPYVCGEGASRGDARLQRIIVVFISDQDDGECGDSRADSETVELLLVFSMRIYGAGGCFVWRYTSTKENIWPLLRVERRWVQLLSVFLFAGSHVVCSHRGQATLQP